MTASELRDVLLVRAAEEARPEAIAPEALVDAHRHAGAMDDESVWIARRADYLLAGPLTDLRPLRAMTTALRGGLLPIVALSTLTGLASNYLGPSNKIHVLFNPIALLIAWNLGAYVVGTIGGLLWPLVRSGTRAGTLPPAPDAARATRPAAEQRGGLLTRLLVTRIVPGVWLRVHRAVLVGATHAADLGDVGRRFWRHWIGAAGGALAPLARRALHVGAIGLALGAVAGMYARGLFLEYDVVWRSTFITDPDAFVRLIRLALGPAALLIGQSLPSEQDAALLLTAKGAPAASWIHLYAVSAGLFIVLPRLVLAAWATWRARRLERQATLDPDDPYVADILERARRLRVEEVETAIQEDVRGAATGFAEALGVFVCEQLYDAELAPTIRAFRQSGGSVAALEDDLGARCEAFRPRLSAEVPVQQQAFERDLTERITRRLGETPTVTSIRRSEMTGKIEAASERTSGDLGGSLGHGLADTVGAAVAAALAVVAGTMGGGFGEIIGIAVLVGLLESGPIGWMVGALGGLIAAGAGWWIGRDALARGLKQVSLPATVLKAILWQSRLDGIIADGRTRCHDAVKTLIEGELGSLTGDVASEIWRRIKPVLGEQQRPGSPRADG